MGLQMFLDGFEIVLITENEWLKGTFIYHTTFPTMTDTQPVLEYLWGCEVATSQSILPIF